MLKKLLSGIGVLAMLLLLMPATSAVILNYIQDGSVQVSVGGNPIDTFYPSQSSATVSFDLLLAADIDVYVIRDSDDVTVATLADKISSEIGAVAIGTPWYGTEGNVAGGVVLPDGIYTVEVVAWDNNNFVDFDSKNVTIATAPAVTITEFTLSPGTSFDPASGSDENLTISYTLNQVADLVRFEVKDFNNNIVKNDTHTDKSTGSFTWDGNYAGKLVEPGTYTVVLTATDENGTDTDSKSINVVYNNANKPTITDFTVSPSSFDPDVEDTIISFKNAKDSDLTVEIRNANGEEVRDFDYYENDNYNADDTHSIEWNGKNNSGNIVNFRNL